MSRTGSKVPGGLNSTVVPTASPTASPTSAPRKRSRRVIPSGLHANICSFQFSIRRTPNGTGQSGAAWWGERAPVLEKLLDPERYPIAMRVGAAAGDEHNAADAPEHSFEFGLQRILDGVQALVDGRSSVG